MEENRSWWQQIKIHPVRTVLIALLSVVVLLIILSIMGYIFNWHWTGLVPESSDPKQHAKTLWDWLQLLIIPAVLAVAGYIINVTISRGEQAATEQRAKSEREAAEKRAETEREIALDNQREAALKEHLDTMSELLLHEGLLKQDSKTQVRQIARIQTLTVLNKLDGKRKGWVLKFLNDAGLIKLDNTIVNLEGANLCKANLSGTNLVGVDLSSADLSSAILGLIPPLEPEERAIKEADLSRANLRNANLSLADLTLVKFI